MTGTPAQAADTYRAAHPDVDPTTNVVVLAKTTQGYEAVGHEPLTPRIDAILGQEQQ